jgi:hypothetical protein
MRLSKEERLNYQEKEPISVYGISNFGGIAIIDIIHDVDEYIVWYDSQIESSEKRKIHVSKIYYSENDCYFKPYGSMYIKLSECSRILA